MVENNISRIEKSFYELMEYFDKKYKDRNRLYHEETIMKIRYDYEDMRIELFSISPIEATDIIIEKMNTILDKSISGKVIAKLTLYYLLAKYVGFKKNNDILRNYEEETKNIYDIIIRMYQIKKSDFIEFKLQSIFGDTNIKLSKDEFEKNILLNNNILDFEGDLFERFLRSNNFKIDNILISGELFSIEKIKNKISDYGIEKREINEIKDNPNQNKYPNIEILDKNKVGIKGFNNKKTTQDFKDLYFIYKNKSEKIIEYGTEYNMTNKKSHEVEVGFVLAPFVYFKYIEVDIDKDGENISEEYEFKIYDPCLYPKDKIIVNIYKDIKGEVIFEFINKETGIYMYYE